MVTISKSDIFEALEVDYRFRGATRAVNRDMQIQQMLGFATELGANLLPKEMRSLMLLIWENFGVRGGSKVVTETGTKTLQQNWDLQNSLAQQQLKLQLMMTQAQQVPAPTSIPVDQAQAVMQQAGISPGQAPTGTEGGGQ